MKYNFLQFLFESPEENLYHFGYLITTIFWFLFLILYPAKAYSVFLFSNISVSCEVELKILADYK